ncbi:hypothetical protein AMECASPLE_039232 [Ameca splendens]|uniref:Reverse transcriptase zinc-binding domain-containing protein n=1 Tax=Ameca splendens TaxID=208324 RepID=A0ABV1A6Y3_9TELE
MAIFCLIMIFVVNTIYKRPKRILNVLLMPFLKLCYVWLQVLWLSLILFLVCNQIGNCSFKDSSLSNKIIRHTLDNILYPTIPFRNSICQFYQLQSIHKLRTKYLKYPIAPKAKEIHFKTLNGIYPSSDFIKKRFGNETINCAFCDAVETTEHLFVQCIYVEALCADVFDWLFPKIPNKFSISSLTETYYMALFWTIQTMTFLSTLLSSLGNVSFIRPNTLKSSQSFMHFIMTFCYISKLLVECIIQMH